MTTFFALTANTVRQWIRARTYIGALMAGVFLIGSSLVLQELSGGQETRTLTDLGLLFVGLTTTAICTTLVLTSLTRELESKEILTLIARPVSRDEVILSRAAAGAIAALVSNATLGLVLTVLGVMNLVEHPGRLFAATMLLSLEAWMMIGVALALAAGSSTAVSAAVATMFFLLARVAPATSSLAHNPLRPVFRYLPRFDRFDVSDWVHGGVLPVDLSWSIVNGLAWAGLLCVLAVVRFRRRDLG